MKPSLYRRAAKALVFFLTTIPAARLLAQAETRWLSLKPLTAYLDMDVESETDTETTGNMKLTSERLYLAPTLGLGLSGSIYHPNLLEFDLKGQGGYIEQNLNSQFGPAKQSSTQTSFLQNYDATLSLLQNQPYAATFNATKTHAFQELDFFNQVTVDSQSCGGHLGYKAGEVPFGISVKHVDESETGLAYNNAFEQDSIDLTAQNERARGKTSLTYEVGQFTQTTSDIAEKQTYQYGTLQDDESFGQDDRGRLSSMAFFNQQDQGSNTADNVTLQENLSLKHSPAWDSFYNYNFNDSYVEPSDTTTHYGAMGLHNQLFESLSSEWDVHGTLQNASAPDETASQTMYGFANTESYNKRLGDWGRLSLGNSVRYDLTHVNNSGTISPVFNEQHVLTDGTPAFLADPRVIAVDKVTDPTGVHIYIQGLDYFLTTAGDLTEIQRVPTSLNLTNNATVLVNYTVQAEPSGGYTTLSDQVQLRLDMFNGLADIYTGAGWVENHAPVDFILENSFMTLSGFDVNWRWLRVGGTYSTQDANLVSYTARGLYQTATFHSGASSTISLNAREQWTDYEGNEPSISDYTLTSRYTERFDRHWDGILEAGVLEQMGGPQAQTLVTAGARIKYLIGKLSLSLSYQFNQQDTLTGQAMRNLISFNARREF